MSWSPRKIQTFNFSYRQSNCQLKEGGNISLKPFVTLNGKHFFLLQGLSVIEDKNTGDHNHKDFFFALSCSRCETCLLSIIG